MRAEEKRDILTVILIWALAILRGAPPMGYQALATRLRWEFKEEHRPGNRLPTIADIAKRHGTDRTTVSRALKLLAGEGLIETIHGRGTYLIGPDGTFTGRNEQPAARVENHLYAVIKTASRGQPLPNTRDLAKQCQASASTIQRARTVLLRRGLIRRAGRGYVRA